MVIRFGRYGLFVWPMWLWPIWYRPNNKFRVSHCLQQWWWDNGLLSWQQLWSNAKVEHETVLIFAHNFQHIKPKYLRGWGGGGWGHLRAGGIWGRTSRGIWGRIWMWQQNRRYQLHKCSISSTGLSSLVVKIWPRDRQQMDQQVTDVGNHHISRSEDQPANISYEWNTLQWNVH